MRFLVIEDDEAVAELLRQMIEDLEHEVVGTAGTAQEAFHLIETALPDALLVDVDLGRGGSGLDVAVHAYIGHGIRSLFVSGNIDGWLRRGMQSIRPYGFLAKPFPPEELAETVSRLA
ncbi:response regulator [Arenibaculum pallidiluteum]|uniref:response regulator n=1 Tax=Arenibaculum pallidiluteum TaxID=2812559 RepID=UPI001A95A2AC|nr:response regulator [Arenibaculum pallidiluteum]